MLSRLYKFESGCSLVRIGFDGQKKWESELSRVKEEFWIVFGGTAPRDGERSWHSAAAKGAAAVALLVVSAAAVVVVDDGEDKSAFPEINPSCSPSTALFAGLVVLLLLFESGRFPTAAAVWEYAIQTTIVQAQNDSFVFEKGVARGDIVVELELDWNHPRRQWKKAGVLLLCCCSGLML